MSRAPYTYTVLRYVHDPVAGESMNIGVLVYAPSSAFVAAEFERSSVRLSTAFSGFNPKHYRAAVRSFKSAVAKMREFMERGVLNHADIPTNALEVVKKFWPDAYMSFRTGELLGGVASDLSSVVAQTFERFVGSQFHKRVRERRDERQLWEELQARFSAPALRHLAPKTIKARFIEHRFEHTFQNSRLHVIEPISLDYAEASTIIDTATRWRGRLDVLSQDSVAKKAHFYFLLGYPHADHKKEVERAKGIILGSSVETEVVDESRVSKFAKKFSDLVLEHSS